LKEKDTISTHDKQCILEAAACLFPPKQVLHHNFIAELDQPGLKQAYLSTLKRNHPEQHKTDSLLKRQERVEFIKNANRAFTFLNSFLNKDLVIEKKLRGNTIIAVGGAKGGIGKSLFSANMAVYLCQQGYRVTAIDLDLGGANLSLYLGENFILKRTINDYLHKKFNNLEDISTKCKHGPRIIGGDSSELGIANIAHTQKLKLIRNIKKLDTDFVILDLGGDTSYNMLDFFLMADCGYVMTTKDSAAYIGAYQFLKTALYRKLRRLTGPEAGRDRIKSGSLAHLLDQTMRTDKIQCVIDLCEHIDQINPLYTPLILHPIIHFNPYLVVNKVTRIHQAIQSGQTISALSEKTLSLHLTLAGSISKNSDIEDNLRNFAPLIAQNPNCTMATEIKKILQKSELL
jgi:flagellar biosynthesis protein FlhG